MISIVIPVYNREDYIGKCLESILLQSYQNYEVIIVNDGSIDKSKQVIEKYRTRFKEFKYIEQKNKGASEARNLGVKYAKGNYLLFIDADDYINYNTLQILHETAHKNKADLVIFGHNKIYPEKNNSISEFIFDMKEDIIYSKETVLDMILNFKIKGYICDKMFRLDLWRKLNLYFEKNRYVEDWYPIVKYTLNSSSILFVDRPIYNYVQHSGSSIHTHGIKVVEDYSYAVTNICILLNEYKHLINEESLRFFKLMTTNEIIHEFYMIQKKIGNQIYKDFSSYELGFKYSIYDIYLCKTLGVKNKISLICWNYKIYHIMKLLLSGGIK